MADVPVVLLHGYPLNRTIWRNQTSLKSPGLIALDFPGFGDSPGRDLQSINDYADWVHHEVLSFGYRDAIVIGHSMGGYVALALARNHPKNVSGLGLICTQARSDTEEARQNRLAIATRVLEEGSTFVAESMAPKLIDEHHAKLRSPLVNELESIIRSTLPASIAQAQRAMASRDDQRSVLSSMRMPVLIVHGAGDQLVPKDRAKEMANSLPNGRLEEFAASGHMAMMEEPERFNAVLTEFVTSIRNT